MRQNPPSTKGSPQCSPYLFYDDLDRAVAFLKKAFGFEERFIDHDDKGKVHHAQLAFGKAVVMFGLTHVEGALRPSRSPKEAGSINAGVYLFVEDVDAHAKKARASGAEILMEPADMHWGDRLYCAADPEGQFWMFATHVKDVSPKEM